MKSLRDYFPGLRDPAVAAGAAEKNLPSEQFLELCRADRKVLEETLVRGNEIDPQSLVGWTFRGANTPAWARAVGIKKFIKGFYAKEGVVWGYNMSVHQNRLAAPWTLPEPHAPKRYGYYQVTKVDPEARDNAYLHAVLLDYSRGKNPRLDPSSRLRDYLVAVDDRGDLLLGKAYLAFSGRRVPVSFFVLERNEPGPATLAR